MDLALHALLVISVLTWPRGGGDVSGTYHVAVLALHLAVEVAIIRFAPEARRPRSVQFRLITAFSRLLASLAAVTILVFIVMPGWPFVGDLKPAGPSNATIVAAAAAAPGCPKSLGDLALAAAIAMTVLGLPFWSILVGPCDTILCRCMLRLRPAAAEARVVPQALQACQSLLEAARPSMRQSRRSRSMMSWRPRPRRIRSPEPTSAAPSAG